MRPSGLCASPIASASSKSASYPGLRARRRAHGRAPRRGARRARLRDALADHCLRRRYELQRLLEQATVTDQALLLHRVLGVVPWIDLVGGELHDVGRRRRLVGVDHDTAAEVAEVVVEGPPGLVAHGLDRRLFALRQVEETARARAENLRDGGQCGNETVGDDEALAAPGLEAIAQLSLAGQEPLELLVRLAVARRVTLASGGRRSSARPRRRTRCPRRRARRRRFAGRGSDPPSQPRRCASRSGARSDGLREGVRLRGELGRVDRAPRRRLRSRARAARSRRRRGRRRACRAGARGSDSARSRRSCGRA